MQDVVRSILDLKPGELYRTLHIDRAASQATIQRAYLRLARDTHPDRNFTAGAEEAFKRVAHARSVLSDKATRSVHDASLDDMSKEKRRPCERRASRKRKERSSVASGDAEGGGPQSHEARASQQRKEHGSVASGDAGSGGLESDEDFDHDLWCSFQGRDTAAVQGGSRAPKLSKSAKRRAAASKASAAACSGQVATEERSAAVQAGKGRGFLGKRPWRRAARIRAKLEAKQAKARSKARRHLQTG
jgi:DnaJ-class molecular chaperone